MAETIEFPENFTIIGNLALALWIALDTLAFLLYDLVAGAVFLLAALIAVYGVLRVSGLPASLLQLQKMHLWLGQISGAIFWKTQPKRLQIQLQAAHCDFLLCANWTFSSCICIVLFYARLRCSKRSCFCLPALVYSL